MLTITIECDAPTGSAIGVKEDLAMYLEQFGDCRVVSIVETQPEQMKLMFSLGKNLFREEFILWIVIMDWQ